MMGLASNDGPRAFWRADLTEATRALVGVLREVRPQVVVTYNENGGYGHPDHIQAHRVAMAAVDASADPAFAPETGEPWAAAKVYWSVLPRSAIQRGIDVMVEAGESNLFGVESADELEFVVPDELVTALVDGAEWLPRKIAAMRAHASQIAADGPFFTLIEKVGEAAFGQEFYQLVRGRRGPGDGLEADLFAGLT
jgi:N-acetyl-1-D-myo-inositol-2-amino-2-deoxy-alpha-D-glucopyranoside deacetylase